MQAARPERGPWLLVIRRSRFDSDKRLKHESPVPKDFWLAVRGRRSAIIWPGGYHARLHPVELLDAQNAVVAKGGDQVSFGGGESPVQPGRTCMLGQKSAFYVMSIVSVIRHH